MPENFRRTLLDGSSIESPDERKPAPEALNLAGVTRRVACGLLRGQQPDSITFRLNDFDVLKNPDGVLRKVVVESATALQRAVMSDVDVPTRREAIDQVNYQGSQGIHLGVRVLLTAKGKAAIDRHRPDLAGSMHELSGGVWEVDFPQGQYGSGGGVTIYPICEIWEKEAVPQGTLNLNYEHVVRVEGRHGELWQNNNLGWSGQPL